MKKCTLNSYTALLLILFIFIQKTSSLKTYSLSNHYSLSEFVKSPSSNTIFTYQALVYLKTNSLLSSFEPRIISFTSTDMRILPQEGYMSNPLRTQYISLISYNNIDLPCHDMFICSVAGYKNEYQVTEFPVDIPDDNKCLAVSQGNILADSLLYFCLENIEDTIFISNLLTERVNGVQRKYYESENIQMMKNSKNGYYYGKIAIYDTHFDYYITDNEKVSFHYDYINGYATNVFEFNYVDWKGNPILVPKKDYCFTINVEQNANFFFCTLYDNKNENAFTLTNANFLIHQYISRINANLHIYNLKKAQTKIKNYDCFKSCGVNILQPIKHEIFTRYTLARHKMTQLVLLKKITQEKGRESLDEVKNKIIDRACLGHEPCVGIINQCIDNGSIKLKKNGAKYANSLNNPFSYVINNQLFDVIKEENSSDGNEKTIYNAPMPDRDELLSAIGVFKRVFKAKEYNNPITSLEEADTYCKIYAYGNEYELKRKLDFLTFSTKKDPFFSYMKNINNIN